MKNILLLLLLNSTFIFSQDIHVPVDTIVKTFHETTIKGKKIKYTAETGMQPVWDNDGKPIVEGLHDPTNPVVGLITYIW